MHVNVYGFEWVCEHSLYVLWPHKGTSGHRSLCLCMCECISADFFHVLYFPFLFSVFYSVSVLFLIVLRIHLMMVHLKGFILSINRYLITVFIVARITTLSWPHIRDWRNQMERRWTHSDGEMLEDTKCNAWAAFKIREKKPSLHACMANSIVALCLIFSPQIERGHCHSRLYVDSFLCWHWLRTYLFN